MYVDLLDIFFIKPFKNFHCFQHTYLFHILGIAGQLQKSEFYMSLSLGKTNQLVWNKLVLGKVVTPLD